MGNQVHPTPLISWIQQQIAQYGQCGATKITRVPRLAAAVPAVLGTEVQAPLLTWRDTGTVIAMYGQEIRGTQAAYAETEVRVQFAGDDDLINNGAAGDFAPMLALFGPNLNWFPIVRRVRRGDTWTITYKNGAANALTPSVLFAVLNDADVGRMQREMDEALRAQASAV